MIEVFGDTFYWIAFTNIQDLAHGPRFRGIAAANVQEMRDNRRVRIVAQTPASFTSGLALYQSRLDKGYSLTDCISMQTMRKEGLTEVLTNDRHFEQEGFRALFRDS